MNTATYYNAKQEIDAEHIHFNAETGNCVIVYSDSIELEQYTPYNGVETDATLQDLHITAEQVAHFLFDNTGNFTREDAHVVRITSTCVLCRDGNHWVLMF